MTRVTNIVLLVLIGILTVAQQSSGPTTQHSGYAGLWWQSVSSDERKGFLAGTDDCLTYDVHKPLRFDESWDGYERLISQFYKASRNLHESVFDVVTKKLGLRRRAVRQQPADYGHDWWLQATPLARRGFIEGLTSCRLAAKRSMVWDTSADECVSQLNYIYDANEPKQFNGNEYQGAVSNAHRQWCSDGTLLMR